jgi:hypothetical protein
VEVQQVGVDSNHLRAQPRCALYVDELTRSGRPGMSEKCLSAKDCCPGDAKVIGVQAIRLIVEEASELRWAQVFFTQSLVLTEEHPGRPAVPILRLSSGRLPGKQTARRGRGAHSAYDGTRRSLDSFWHARDALPAKRGGI